VIVLSAILYIDIKGSGHGVTILLNLPLPSSSLVRTVVTPFPPWSMAGEPGQARRQSRRGARPWRDRRPPGAGVPLACSDGAHGASRPTSPKGGSGGRDDPNCRARMPGRNCPPGGMDAAFRTGGPSAKRGPEGRGGTAAAPRLGSDFRSQGNYGRGGPARCRRRLCAKAWMPEPRYGGSGGTKAGSAVLRPAGPPGGGMDAAIFCG